VKYFIEFIEFDQFSKMESYEPSADEDDIVNEFILSLCWDNGVLAATFYNLATLELHVSFH
jgi:hypothetical protein